MPFEVIRFHNFRNLIDAEVPVRSGQVFFIGENGQGKTNFLEAVYILCYGKSFRSSSDLPLIKQNSADMGIVGIFKNEDSISNTKIQMRNGKKEIFNNDKAIIDRKELIDKYPCIIFCHEDIDFVRGGPEFQRQFFDQTASLLYPSYLDDLRNYGKILKTRNLLIKEQNFSLIPIYDAKLVEFGLLIQDRRHQLVSEFNTIFTPIFKYVSQNIDNVKVQYLPSWAGLDRLGASQRLKDRLNRDLALKTTTSGPHRDKFHFYRDNLDFTQSASTGQVRLMSLLLRLAQATLLHDICAKKPILLLDDVLLELDFEKRKRFLSKLPAADQEFYTFLPDERVTEYMHSSSLCYRVNEGGFHEENR